MPDQPAPWPHREARDVYAEQLADRIRDACLVEALDDLDPDATDEQVVALAARRLHAVLARLADRDLARRLQWAYTLRARRLGGQAALDHRRLAAVTPLDAAVHALRHLERNGHVVVYCGARREPPAEILCAPALVCGLARGHDSDHATILRRDGDVTGPGFTWPRFQGRM